MRGHFEAPFDGRFFWYGPALIALVLLALFVAGLVVAIVLAVRNRPGRLPGGDPLQLAAARYASGKIDRAQFEQIQRDLAVPPAAAGAPPSATPATSTPENGG